MYFPYLRGRQFDLIAIRELVEKNLIDEHIVPIIEPIKLSSTLISTLRAFVETQREVLLIQNPCVGNFANELETHELYEEYVELLKNPYIVITHFFNENSVFEIPEITTNIEKKIEDLAIIHKKDNIGLLPIYKEIYSSVIPKYTIIPYEQAFRRRMRGQNLVCLKNEFKKQKRNTDYAIDVDEFFSEEHLHYNSEGLLGFSDYSVVGDDYSEGGFAPYAIALHIVYFAYDNDNSDYVLRIRHFVSDSNDDIRDPALKCSEALKKLEEWTYTIRFDNLFKTYAIEQLLEHFYRGAYPGLPTLKKLALMHHIQLVNIFLRGEVTDELL
ncbi:sce7725 family protein [Lysinibacillus louembei]|uniref:Sce7725 family protein n=1 Tax=Lysinibacillus louembei TaxID=1470088 RepID=A0ABZ0RS14_9BACI|nr:sce7725 family protein [Lysinibacillus louembei]WPK10285.1 sce7725 family protein [Lysinibacillus louembei]